MAEHKAPSSLSINIHRNRSQTDCDGDSANDENVYLTPCVAIQSEIECRTGGENVLREAHHCESLRSLVAMRVHYVRDNTSDSELDAQVDHPQAHNHRNWPWITRFNALTPSKKASP